MCAHLCTYVMVRNVSLALTNQYLSCSLLSAHLASTLALISLTLSSFTVSSTGQRTETVFIISKVILDCNSCSMNARQTNKWKNEGLCALCLGLAEEAEEGSTTCPVAGPGRVPRALSGLK